MELTHRARAFMRDQLDRIFEAAVAWVKKSPRTYGLRNRRGFTGLKFHEIMLADTARVEAYAEALPRLVKPTDTVLDLGTGTGILAFLASLAGARIVHAVDHAPVIEAAREVADKNGLTNVVFHPTHSRSLRLDTPVDVLVHEQMGDALFEERMVSNIAEVRDRLLAPGGIIVPGRFDFFVEPARLKAPYVVPFIWQQNIRGIDFSILRERSLAEQPRYRRFELPAHQIDRPLTTPAPALTVDLHTASPDDLPHVLEFERVVQAPGTVHGLAVWFRAVLDDRATISTAPFDLENSNWKTPFLRLDVPIDVAAGDRLRIRLEAETLEVPDTWTWSVQPMPA
jgi:protein arginine N-methyltransferase 1